MAAILSRGRWVKWIHVLEGYENVNQFVNQPVGTQQTSSHSKNTTFHGQDT